MVSQHFGEAPFFALVAVRRSDGVIEGAAHCE
jgi:predicted Fe-Mo cluster-binding NifX family protein